MLRPGGPFVCTFSNRLFPTKAIRGWLATDDQEHCAIVSTYFRRSGGWTDPIAELRTPLAQAGDPLYAVYAWRRSRGERSGVLCGDEAIDPIPAGGAERGRDHPERHPSRLAHRPGLHAGLRLRAHPLRAASPDGCGPARHGRPPRPHRRAARGGAAPSVRPPTPARSPGWLRSIVMPSGLHRCSRRRWSTSSAADYRSRITRAVHAPARGAARPASSCCAPTCGARRRYRAGARHQLRRRRRAQPARRVEARRPRRPTPRRPCCSRSTAAPGRWAEGGPGRAADGPPRRAGLGVRHRQLPAVAAGHLARPHRRREAGARVDQGEHRRARRRPRLRRHHRRLGRRPPRARSPRSPRTSPSSSPASRTPTPAVAAAVPFYGVYDFINRHGTGRADMEGFLAKRVFKSTLDRGPRPLGAGVDRSATSGRTPRRSSCSTAPTTRSCPSSRPARSSTSCARRRPTRSSTPSCPARSTRSRCSRRCAPTPPSHAVERFLAVVRSEHGGPTPGRGGRRLGGGEGLTAAYDLVVHRRRPGRREGGGPGRVLGQARRRGRARAAAGRRHGRRRRLEQDDARGRALPHRVPAPRRSTRSASS